MQLDHNYKEPFVLDESKLHRIQSVLEERFEELGDYGVEHTVRLRKGQTITASTLDEILRLDNPVSNPIVALVTSAWAGDRAASVDSDVRKALAHRVNAEHFFQVEFSTFSWSSIELRTRSSDSKWAHGLASALEEQVDRVVQKSWFAKLVTSELRKTIFALVMILGCFFGIFGFVRLSTRPGLAQSMWLTSADIEALASLDEVDHREVLKIQLRNIREKPSELQSHWAAPSWQLMAALLPIGVVIVSIIYLAARCYPSYVFAWGDMAEWYSHVLQKRRVLWITVILGSVIGLLSNLAVYGAIAGLSIR